MAETPVPSTEAPKTETPTASPADNGTSADRSAFATTINQWMGREVNPATVLRAISESEGKKGYSADWQKVTQRNKLIHKTLTPEARAWNSAHREEIQGMYDNVTENRKLSPRESFDTLARVIDEHHRNHGGASLREEIAKTQKSGPYQDEVNQRIAQRTAETGRQLPRRELARIKRDVLIATVKRGREDTQEQARAQDAKAQAEKARAKAEQEEAAGDPLFQQKFLEVFEERGLDTERVSDDELSSVKQEAFTRFTVDKQDRARELDDVARNEPSYKTEFLRLVGTGVSPEDARQQALEFTKREMDKDKRKANAERNTREADARARSEQSNASDAAERQRIRAQPGFEEAMTAEVKALRESGESLTAENVKAARERAMEKYKNEEKARREQAKTSKEFDETFAGLIAGREDLTDEDIKALETQALDQAVNIIKSKEEAQAREAAEKESAEAETAQQKPEDVLKGLEIDIASADGKSLLDAMNADPESAKAVIQKIQQAKEFQSQVLSAAERLGMKIDSESVFKTALGGIVEQYKSDLISETNPAADGKIKKLLEMLLAVMGGVVAAGATAVVGATGEVVHRARNPKQFRPR